VDSFYTVHTARSDLLISLSCVQSNCINCPYSRVRLAFQNVSRVFGAGICVVCRYRMTEAFEENCLFLHLVVYHVLAFRTHFCLTNEECLLEYYTKWL
jgi:hypothetical protein